MHLTVSVSHAASQQISGGVGQRGHNAGGSGSGKGGGRCVTGEVTLGRRAAWAETARCPLMSNRFYLAKCIFAKWLGQFLQQVTRPNPTRGLPAGSAGYQTTRASLMSGYLEGVSRGVDKAKDFDNNNNMDSPPSPQLFWNWPRYLIHCMFVSRMGQLMNGCGWWW